MPYAMDMWFDNVRTDSIGRMFRTMKLLETDDFPHTPFIAIVVPEDRGDPVTVKVITRKSNLLLLPWDTTVLMQWPGQHVSNFFRFTVGDLAQWIMAQLASPIDK